MRKIPKIPRILQINSIKGLKVSVVFNNGEERVIDFKKSFGELLNDKSLPASKLLRPSEFKKMKLNNYTLSWDGVGSDIEMNNRKVRMPFEIGPDTLYAVSIPVGRSGEEKQSIGSQIKAVREKEGMTQLELANRSGTSRTYISRVEKGQSGIEIHTLQRIVKYGLRKKLEIRIKP
jgi:DNA-binding XRE family transcriptional regulator